MEEDRNIYYLNVGSENEALSIIEDFRHRVHLLSIIKKKDDGSDDSISSAE